MLEKLKQIDLRKQWQSEPVNFTNWLAEPENLELLSDEIGVEMELIETEANVGSFNVDILAKEKTSNRKIIIENQLEKTNHTHLGQIITYASGCDAEIIIWIVKEVREEHEKAINWLNDHTDEEISFFAIKMELWQIGDSPYAPKFNIVAKPNDWAKAIKAQKSGELSVNALKQIAFFEGFVNYCKTQGTTIRLSNPQQSTPSYYSISIGTSSGWITIKLNSSQKSMKIDLYLQKKDYFYALKEKESSITKELGTLIWDEMPNYKGSNIGLLFDFDIEKESNFEKKYEQMKETVEKFYKVFKKELNRLNK
ncbi:MAG: DUF4268 domain-containing protein [Nanoarchaeota archaeon]|nr:DUF4268 domain-containing protein [Nanoarchaeota archaeon]